MCLLLLVCSKSWLFIMAPFKSSLSNDQKKKLCSLLGHVRLHLIYKATVHSFTADAFHSYCDKQGPTVIIAYNAAGFIFGAYISKDYIKSGQPINDDEAFLYSISAGTKDPLRVAVISGQCAFIDVASGPNFGALVFLHEDKPLCVSNPGTSFQFQPAAMHGDDLVLTELEVCRVEGVLYFPILKSLLYKISANASHLSKDYD